MFNKIIIFHSYTAFLGHGTTSLFCNYLSAHRTCLPSFSHPQPHQHHHILYLRDLWINFLFPLDQINYLLLKSVNVILTMPFGF